MLSKSLLERSAFAIKKWSGLSGRMLSKSFRNANFFCADFNRPWFFSYEDSFNEFIKKKSVKKKLKYSKYKITIKDTYVHHCSDEVIQNNRGKRINAFRNNSLIYFVLIPMMVIQVS